MTFFENQYCHFFNRTNNQEALFRSRENYIYFLKKYRHYLDGYFDTIAYCLMPTHFHFLVKVKKVANSPEDLKSLDESRIGSISNQIAILLRSYTRAYNKMWQRNGNLFTQKSKAFHIKDENYFINLVFYIHQNPIRSNLVENAEDWEFSSFQDYIDLRKGSLPKMDLIRSKFTLDEVKDLSKTTNIHPMT